MRGSSVALSVPAANTVNLRTRSKQGPEGRGKPSPYDEEKETRL